MSGAGGLHLGSCGSWVAVRTGPSLTWDRSPFFQAERGCPGAALPRGPEGTRLPSVQPLKVRAEPGGAGKGAVSPGSRCHKPPPRQVDGLPRLPYSQSCFTTV